MSQANYHSHRQRLDGRCERSKRDDAVIIVAGFSPAIFTRARISAQRLRVAIRHKSAQCTDHVHEGLRSCCAYPQKCQLGAQWRVLRQTATERAGGNSAVVMDGMTLVGMPVNARLKGNGGAEDRGLAGQGVSQRHQTRAHRVTGYAQKPGNAMITLLLVDDQPQVLRGLGMRLALEPDVVVIGEAADAEAALQLAEQLNPDVVVMDVELPGMDGIAATQMLKHRSPDRAVVMLSLHDDAMTQRRAREAGASAFVAKHRMEGPLLAAIREAAGHAVS